jgi:chemotaxis protein histidine kinase CheA
MNVGEEKYAVSITNVVETVYITDEGTRTIGGQEAIVIRDSILPLHRLHDIFGVPPGIRASTLRSSSIRRSRRSPCWWTPSRAGRKYS